VHLVGFIIRIYHDARSPERQICILTFMFLGSKLEGKRVFTEFITICFYFVLTSSYKTAPLTSTRTLNYLCIHLTSNNAKKCHKEHPYVTELTKMSV